MKYGAEVRDEAKRIYLELGPERAVDHVHNELVTRHGTSVPSLRQLFRWKEEDAWDETLDELRARQGEAELEAIQRKRLAAAERQVQLGQLAQARGGKRLQEADPADLTIDQTIRLIDRGLSWEREGLAELGAPLETVANLIALARARGVDSELVAELARQWVGRGNGT